MSFVAILVALLLEQARPVGKGNPIHGLLRVWARWTDRNFDAGKVHYAWLAWCVAVGVPTLFVLAIYWVLVHTVGWPAGIVWNIAVLYVTLGFRQFSHHFTRIRDALEAADEAQARRFLAEWKRIDASGLPRSEIVRQVIEHSVLAAHRHVFAVLAWFAALAALGLGPAGAVFYRMSEFVPRYWSHREDATLHPVSPALRGAAAWMLIDWLPARITAVGFAVVGSFEEAIESWRAYARSGGSGNDGVILAATAGALNLRLGPLAGPPRTAAGRAVAVGLPYATPADDAQAGAAEPEVGHLRTVVGLVWRSVVMWMILLALLTLARLLG
jgi:adenosylcobinamide-phosphate synthase